MWELLLSGWHKLNFDDSVIDDRAAPGFFIRSDIRPLVRDSSFLFIILSMSETKIEGLWEALVRVSNVISVECIMLEWDIQDIIHSFYECP